MATYDLTSITPSGIKTGDILNCPYSGTYKNITLPAGTYKLECWGAQGGTGNPSSNIGGKGGYSVGTLILFSETVCYLYSGSAGYDRVETVVFNGGGMAEASSSYNSGSGGGASDVRIGQDSLYARVIVAGGGGGGAGANETTYTGGYGGGVTGGDTTTNSAGASTNIVTGGGATSAGTSSNPSSYTGLNGSFGLGGSYSGGGTRSGGGGGGGWYGGAAGSYGNGGGGGSGYVYTSATASNYPSGCLLNSKYYLTSASTVAGNTSFTSPTGSSETGHSGNGYVRITAIRVSGMYLKNLLIYGNFENTGWVNAYRTTLAYVTSPTAFGTYSLKVAASDTTSTETYFRQNTTATPLVQNHVYYFSCYVYLPTANAATAIEAYWPEAEPVMGTMNLDQTKVGQWQRVSVVTSRTNWSSGSYQFRLDVQPMASPNYVYLDGAMLIDLTESYGEGNEPDKTWCDNHISFFEGEISREYTGTKVYIKVNNIWKEIEL